MGGSLFIACRGRRVAAVSLLAMALLTAAVLPGAAGQEDAVGDAHDDDAAVAAPGAYSTTTKRLHRTIGAGAGAVGDPDPASSLSSSSSGPGRSGASAASGDPFSYVHPHDPSKRETCELMGTFSQWVQLMGGLLAAGALVLRWQMEEPPRPTVVWAMDASKTGLSQLMAHYISIYIAFSVSADAPRVVSPCSWYLIVFLADVTLGLALAYAFLRLTSLVLVRVGLGVVAQSGDYGQVVEKDTGELLREPNRKVFAWQLGIWLVGCVLPSRVICGLLIYLLRGPLGFVAVQFSREFKGYPRLELVVVLFCGPVLLNALQFFVQDLILALPLTAPAGQHAKRSIQMEVAARSGSVGGGGAGDGLTGLAGLGTDFDEIDGSVDGEDAVWLGGGGGLLAGGAGPGTGAGAAAAARAGRGAAGTASAGSAAATVRKVFGLDFCSDLVGAGGGVVSLARSRSKYGSQSSLAGAGGAGGAGVAREGGTGGGGGAGGGGGGGGGRMAASASGPASLSSRVRGGTGYGTWSDDEGDVDIDHAAADAAADPDLGARRGRPGAGPGAGPGAAAAASSDLSYQHPNFPSGPVGRAPSRGGDRGAPGGQGRGGSAGGGGGKGGRGGGVLPTEWSADESEEDPSAAAAAAAAARGGPPGRLGPRPQSPLFDSQGADAVAAAVVGLGDSLYDPAQPDRAAIAAEAASAIASAAAAASPSPSPSPASAGPRGGGGSGEKKRLFTEPTPEDRQRRRRTAERLARKSASAAGDVAEASAAAAGGAQSLNGGAVPTRRSNAARHGDVGIFF